ncbi:MAG: Uma2 family endonuclease [Planctomycetia bacterium]|nr:Uma2 family endonuclease [Planctomycetia bacterium]
MNAVAAETSYSPDDLLAMPDEKDHELVDGRLVERNASALSSWVSAEILFQIRFYLKDNPVGLFFGSDNGYQCFPDQPGKVPRADVSFIQQDRLPENWQEVGYLRTPADLMVEVVSPNDLAYEVEEKILEDLNAGVPLVWVVNPEIRVVRVHRADFTSASLTGGDELSGEGVLPGFRCRVAALFPPAAVAPPK